MSCVCVRVCVPVCAFNYFHFKITREGKGGGMKDGLISSEWHRCKSLALTAGDDKGHRCV